MNKIDIKHSVIIITYNQEDYIGTCIQSVLDQQPGPYEIIVGDDASTDRTSSLLLEYKNRYPGIIKLYRHKVNLGIFRNFNALMPKVTGDIVSSLGGDDFFKPGLFSALNQEIIRNKLDPHSKKFILVTNVIYLHTDGTEKIFDNFRIRKNNLLKERLRYGFDFRDVGLSRKLWDSLDPIPEDYGIFGDWFYGFDQIRKSEQFFFLNQAFAVYRLGVGISSNLAKNKIVDSRLTVLNEIINRHSGLLDSSDLRYIYMEINRIRIRTNPNGLRLLKLFFQILYNINNFSVNNSFRHRLKLFINNTMAKCFVKQSR